MNKLYFLLLFAVIRPALAMDPGSPEALLATLTLEQKVAQLFMVPVVADEDMNSTFMANSPYRMDQDHVLTMIEDFEVGSVIFLGKGTPEAASASIKRMQSSSNIPLLVGIDAEWGLSMRFANTLRFPCAMTLGALAPKNDDLIRKLARKIGDSCKELGIGMNFAPVADVNNNPENPIIGSRSFGENPELVARKAALFTRGLIDAGILACAKHFPGHGDTKTDSHVTLPVILHDRAHLDAVELRPFRELIAQQVPAIMTAHLLVPALNAAMPASASPEITTDLLQQELKFEGLIITDGLGMGALTKHFKPGEIELNALLAGNDILLGMLDIPVALSLITQAIQAGRISEEELNRRVLKVLRAKEWIARHEGSLAEQPSGAFLKKEIYFCAITLVKNNKNTLPFKPHAYVEIKTIGTPAQAKFKDTMNRYIFDKEETKTTLLAIYPTSRSRMIEEWSHENEFGEKISLTQHIAQLHKEHKSVVAILFGSPYKISEIADADAILCAYEDDEDAQYGAALAALGFFNPTGILPVTAHELFPAGTGLRYGPPMKTCQ